MIIINARRGGRVCIGNQVKLIISEVHGSQVKIGIEAPKEIKIYRKEIYDRIQIEKQSDTKEVDDGQTEK